MALYIPQARRHRQLVMAALAAFLLGGVLGGLVGRVTAPTSAEEVATVRAQARQISAQLRVLSLHVEAGAPSLGAGGDAGAGLALRRTESDLARALDQAPWVTVEHRNALATHLHQLESAASSGAASARFGADVDRLATEVDTTFGLRPTP